MNIRQVLKAFTALRQLTDDESALLETLRGATEAEREMIAETLLPQKTTAKRASKKSSKSALKSAHGQSISNAIQRTAKSRVGDSDNGDASGQCSDCGMTADMPIHDPDGGYLNYHPFVSAVLPEAHEASAGG